jgi:hypothetical protein
VKRRTGSAQPTRKTNASLLSILPAALHTTPAVAFRGESKRKPHCGKRVKE